MRRSWPRAIPGSRGEAYNITSQGRITQREFIDLFADALKVPRVTRHVPYPLAFAGGFLLEIRDRLLMRERPPRVTRYGAWLLGRHLEYSTEKARSRLGWQPAIGYAESIERTLRGFWIRSATAAPELRAERSTQVDRYRERRGFHHFRREHLNDRVHLQAGRPAAEPVVPGSGLRGFRRRART